MSQAGVWMVQLLRWRVRILQFGCVSYTLPTTHSFHRKLLPGNHGMTKAIALALLLVALTPLSVSAQLPHGFFDVELRTVPVVYHQLRGGSLYER